MILEDGPNPKDSPVFIRGEAENKGRFPRPIFWKSCHADPGPVQVRSGRVELANDIASTNNPLTAGDCQPHLAAPF